MILTVTLNAAIDKLYLVEQLTDYTVMRVKECHNTAGGKGLNVSKVASLLGEKVIASGFVGGHTGRSIESMLEQQGVVSRFTHTASETRCCVNVRDLSTGKHTEFLEPGAPVTEQEADAFFAEFCRLLPQAEIVCISGSVPKGISTDFYGKLIREAKAQNKRVVLDTSGELLIQGVKALPDLVKPNTDEIAQLLGRQVSSEEELLAAAKELKQSGISTVVISLGKEGALVVCDEGIYRGYPPKIEAVNTVGCGDSMVAGFAVGMSRGLSMEESFRIALAVSAANAMNMETGNFEPTTYERLLPQARVEKMN